MPPPSFLGVRWGGELGLQELIDKMRRASMKERGGREEEESRVARDLRNSMKLLTNLCN